jgi:hypothetical protein
LAATETLVTNPYFSAEAHAKRLDQYLTLAAEAHARGFTSEAKRKEALDWASRAYGEARSILGAELRAQFPWNETTRSYPAAFLALSDVAPHDLHQWRPKHAQALAGYPDFVGRVTTLAALREGIKGQPLQAKQPKPKTAAQLAKEATQMTCQICNRPIFAERGRIAHHGYERPGTGWQTASCEGALKLPFEVSKDALVNHIERIRAHIERTELLLAETIAEHASVPYRYTSQEREPGARGRFGAHRQKTLQVTRDSFAAKLAEIAADRAYGTGAGETFDRTKDAAVRALQGELEASRDYLAAQVARAAAWTQTHRTGAKAEHTWVAL